MGAQVGLGSLEMKVNLLTTNQGTAGTRFCRIRLGFRALGPPSHFEYLQASEEMDWIFVKEL